MSMSEAVMLVGGAIAVVLGAIEVSRSNLQSLIGWAIVTLGAVFVILALL